MEEVRGFESECQDTSSIGQLTVAYPPNLHINRATNIKILHARVCHRLLIYDLRKKKGFKLTLLWLCQAENKK